MKRAKKWLAFWASTLAFVLLLTACGSTSSAAPPAGDSGGGSAAAADAGSGGNRVITMLDVMATEEHTKAIKEMIASFEAANPGVTVEYSTVPWEEAYQKVMAMAASNSLPDVNTGSYIELAAAGKVIPLDKYWDGFVEKYEDDLSDAFTSYRANMSYQGQVFRIPDGNIFRGVYIRSDWLEEAGIDIESLRNWTWDDYFTVVETLTDPAQGRYGAAFRGGMGGFDGFMEYACSELEALDAYPDKENSPASIMDDPRAPELWEKWMGIYMNGWAPKEAINWGFKEMVNGFTSGQCATVIQTPEVTLNCEETMEDGTWTVLPFPVPADAEVHAFNWGPTASYSISSNAKDPDLAWSLIEHFSSPENNLMYSKTYSVFPNFKSGLNDPFFQEGALKGYADSLLDPKLEYCNYGLYLAEWSGFTNETMKVTMQEYLSGGMDTASCIEVARAWFADQYEAEVANAQ